MNRQRLLLAALAGVFLLSLAYAFWAMPRQEKAPPRSERPLAKSASAAKGTKADMKGNKADERLHLEWLEDKPQPFAGAGRDIFRFRGGWAPPVVAPVAATSAPPVEVLAPPPPPTPEQVLRDKVSRFTFLGFLDKGGVKTVFLSSVGEIYLVKQGENFGKNGEMVAQEITARELVVSSPGVADVVRVQLVENQRLTPTMFGAGSSTPGPALRPGGFGGSPRRLLPQRVLPHPPEPVAEPPEQETESDVQPPDDGVKQEELPKQGLPGGDGNGNTQ